MLIGHPRARNMGLGEQLWRNNMRAGVKAGERMDKTMDGELVRGQAVDA